MTADDLMTAAPARTLGLKQEIERLQTERDGYKTLMQQWKGMAKDQSAEIEKLRARVRELEDKLQAERDL